MIKAFVLVFLLLPIIGHTQQDSLSNQLNNHIEYQVFTKKAKTTIKIDGVLDEKDWDEATPAKDFWEKYPDNKKRATTKTEVRVTYDEHFLYFGATCFDTTSHHIIPTLKRDVNYFDGDGIAVVLDPINRQSNGYLFGVSPFGVQSETTIQSFGDPTWSWDNIWYTEVKQYADRWTVEIAIPFKTLRYEAGKTIWGINFIRNDIKHGQYHTWARIPLQFFGYSLGFYGTLHWDAPPPIEHTNIAVIPYLLGGASKDFENKEKTESVLRGGADAKIALNSQLNLDATVNPDFSQIDVDEQITNLTRFNILYPEKRTFFLENSDVLAELGSPPGQRPFFSRRIGLDENAQRVPIQFGARLSGNLNKSLRINALDMQTAKTSSQPAYNYGAVAIQQALTGRSFFKLGFLNRQGFNDTKNGQSDYKRNLAGELSYTSKNNQWDAWLLMHHSMQPNITKQNNFFETGVWYHNERLEFLTFGHTVGTNYQTGMDFFQRLQNHDDLLDTTYRIGYKENINIFIYKIIAKQSSKLAQYQFQAINSFVWNADNTFNDRLGIIQNNFMFKNTSEIKVHITNEDSRLPVNVAFTDYTPLPPRQYVFTNASLIYTSDRRKLIYFRGQITAGQFYNGRQLAMIAGINLRQTPWGLFSLRLERYDLRFPDPYKNSLLYLINGKAEFSFARNLFWTTFLQYNTQADNFNINSRLQWRYKPMSDVFLVYTDNYAAQPFAKKNRALVLKMNYWFNL